MPGPPAWAGVPGHSSRGARHAACWLTYTGPFASPVQDRKPNGKAPCGPGLASRILSRCDVQSFWCLSSAYFVLFLSRSWGQRIRMDGVSSQRLMSQSCAGSASENMICYISLSSWTLIGLCSGWMDSVYCCLCVCVRERRGEMERERRRDGIVETDGERERERETGRKGAYYSSSLRLIHFIQRWALCGDKKWEETPRAVAGIQDTGQSQAGCQDMGVATVYRHNSCEYLSSFTDIDRLALSPLTRWSGNLETLGSW